MPDIAVNTHITFYPTRAFLFILRVWEWNVCGIFCRLQVTDSRVNGMGECVGLGMLREEGLLKGGRGRLA